jgi:CRP-like cAMP-binding protein
MMKPAPFGENRLLKQLGAADLAVLEPSLKKFEMIQGTVLHEPGGTINHVYFPTAGMISILAVMKTGEQIETGIVGREGVVGASVGMFGPLSFGQSTVQIPGAAWQLKSDAFVKLYNTSETFRQATNAFQSVVVMQAQQSAACHALHTVEARLCRWLLQSRDVIESNVICLTQEFLSHMLGVQRTAVSLSATALQKRGLVTYSRGNIRILDHDGLRKGACECYDVICEQVNRASQCSMAAKDRSLS